MTCLLFYLYHVRSGGVVVHKKTTAEDNQLEPCCQQSVKQCCHQTEHSCQHSVPPVSPMKCSSRQGKIMDWGANSSSLQEWLTAVGAVFFSAVSFPKSRLPNIFVLRANNGTPSKHLTAVARALIHLKVSAQWLSLLVKWLVRLSEWEKKDEKNQIRASTRNWLIDLASMEN